MGCGNMGHGHVVQQKNPVDLVLVIVTTIMNVQGILHVETTTVWDPYFPLLRIVVKIHPQPLQPPQQLQQQQQQQQRQQQRLRQQQQQQLLLLLPLLQLLLLDYYYYGDY